MELVSHTIQFEGQSIFVQKWSSVEWSKTPIILLHESLGCVALWRDFPEKLAQLCQRDVIAYDRLGFGKSSALAGLDFQFIVNEAQTTFAQVLKFFNLEQFIVMGHSVGGAMSAVISATYPEQCQAVITVASQAMIEEQTLEGIREAEVEYANELFLNKLAKYHGAKAEWVLRTWIDTWLSPQFKDWAVDEYIAKNHSPLLVLHGENDQYGSLQQPQRFYRLTQGAKKLKVLKDCGHFPHLEKQTEVLNAVHAFLDVYLRSPDLNE